MYYDITNFVDENYYNICLSRMYKLMMLVMMLFCEYDDAKKNEQI